MKPAHLIRVNLVQRPRPARVGPPAPVAWLLRLLRLPVTLLTDPRRAAADLGSLAGSRRLQRWRVRRWLGSLAGGRVEQDPGGQLVFRSRSGALLLEVWVDPSWHFAQRARLHVRCTGANRLPRIVLLPAGAPATRDSLHSTALGHPVGSLGTLLLDTRTYLRAREWFDSGKPLMENLMMLAPDALRLQGAGHQIEVRVPLNRAAVQLERVVEATVALATEMARVATGWTEPLSAPALPRTN